MNPLFRSTTTPRFWACFKALPVEIQEQAAKQYELFLEDPFHPPIRLKQIDVFWSVRISGSLPTGLTRFHLHNNRDGVASLNATGNLHVDLH